MFVQQRKNGIVGCCTNMSLYQITQLYILLSDICMLHAANYATAHARFAIQATSGGLREIQVRNHLGKLNFLSLAASAHVHAFAGPPKAMPVGSRRTTQPVVFASVRAGVSCNVTYFN